MVLTGANSGIGLHATRNLLARGWRVAALDVDTDAVGDLGDLGHDGDLAVLRCDVRSDADVASAVRAVLDRWGRIDVLVNNAAVAPFARFEEMPPEDMRAVFDVNLFGYARTIAAVLPAMKAQGHGTIVNVASMLALMGLPTLPAYAASKGAVDGLTRSLALDLRRHGIRVILFHPPSTRTPAAAPLCLPKVFTGDPVKVGAALARAVRSRRRLVTADRRTAVLLVVGRLAPGTFGRLLSRLVAMSQAASARRRRSAPTSSSVLAGDIGERERPR